MSRNKQQILPLASIAILYTATNILNAEEKAQINTLKTITVTEETASGTETKDFLDIKESLEKIAGGTNAIDLEKISTSKSTLYDVLSTEPGVNMQEFFGGNGQPRINIRGSATQGNPVTSGINLLYDGTSINQPDGSFVIGLINPMQHHAISVYRGANAMRYGVASLGGAINYISKTALNSTSYINLEASSFEARNINLGIGEKIGKFDYFANIGYSTRKGYRKVSESQRKDFSFNLGYQINDRTENRTFISYTDNFFHIPFTLQKQLVKEHPNAVIGDGYAVNYPGPLEGKPPLKAVWNARGGWDGVININKIRPFRDTQMLRVSNKTSINQDDGTKYEFTLYGQKTDDDFKDPFNYTLTESTSMGINFYTQGQSPIFDTGIYQLSLNYNTGSMPIEYWVTTIIDGPKAFQYADLKRDADNFAANFQYNVFPSESIELVADIQYIRNTRDISGKASTPMTQGGFDKKIQDLNKDYTYSAFNPKLGVIMHTSETNRFFANISKSIETPTFLQLVNTLVFPLKKGGSKMPPFTNPALVSGANLVDLEEQRAITYEIGTTGKWNNLSWQASYYYSKVKDELITQVDISASNGNTKNYPGDTIHKGLELGMYGKLANNLFTNNDNIGTKIVYNHNDFTFDGGVYDGNEIAGIPRQTLFVELSYSLGDYFTIAPNLRMQLDETYVDHKNMQAQDTFELLGLKMSYSPTTNLSLYADLRNLTDEVYEASFVVRGASGPAAPTFFPGAGVNGTLGIKYTW